MSRTTQPFSTRALAPLLAALLTLAGLVALAPAASAAPTAGFRFWGYFQQVDGEWKFAQTGPDATQPADGSVEGWRYAATSESDARFPRATPTFDDVCGGTEPVEGAKRVAVVVDYGRAADNADGAEPPDPRAACAVVPSEASGNDVLAEVAQIRSQQGLTCAIDAFPATGCGESVSALPEEAKAADEEVQLTGLADANPAAGDAGAQSDAGQSDAGQSDAGQSDAGDGPGASLWIGLAVVLLVVAIGVAAMRRRGAGD